MISASATTRASSARGKDAPPVVTAAAVPASTGAMALAQVCGRAPSSQSAAVAVLVADIRGGQPSFGQGWMQTVNSTRLPVGLRSEEHTSELQSRFDL